MNYAQQLDDMMRGEGSPLFEEEELVNGKPPADAVMVEGLVRNFGFHPGRLQALKPRLQAIISGVVKDEFYPGTGDGYTFMALAQDRQGNVWAEHRTAEMLVVLSIGLGLAKYLVHKQIWHALPGGMPYIQFFKE